MRIRLLATEQELFENRAKPTKSMKIEDFGLSFFELSVIYFIFDLVFFIAPPVGGHKESLI